MATPRRNTSKSRVTAVGTTKGQAVTKVAKEHDYSYGKATTPLQMETKRRIYQAQQYQDGV